MSYLTSEQAIQYLQTATNTVYSDEQVEVMRHTGGMVIMACAGAGKTTALTHLIMKRKLTGEIQNGSRIMCTTYSKAGADEMNERLRVLSTKLGIPNDVQVKTLHALYLNVMRRFEDRQYNVIDNRTRMKFVREALKENDISVADDAVERIDTLLSYQVNNLLNDSALIQSYVADVEGVGLAEYTKIREAYAEKKNKAGLIDFDDMQLWMLFRLSTPETAQATMGYCASMWSDYYVDEAQDISRIQFEILRKLVTDSNRLIMIGDDDQCIYQWRGANPRIIVDVTGYYDIKKFVLSTNYRCRANIVNMAAEGIRHNRVRFEKTMRPYMDGGSVKAINCGKGDMFEMSKYAYSYIRCLLEEKHVKPGDIAVLSRNNAHLAVLSNMLLNSGYPCKTSSEMKLTRSYVYKEAKSIMEFVENPYNDRVTEAQLWKLCTYMKSSHAKAFAKLQRIICASIWDVIDIVLQVAESYGRITSLKDIKTDVKLPQEVKKGIFWTAESLRQETIDSLKRLYALYKTAVNNEERVAVLFAFVLTNCQFRAKLVDQKRLLEGIYSYIACMVVERGYRETQSFLRSAQQYEENDVAVPSNSVCMSTMHGAKGREWPYVIIMADDNDCFPSFEVINMMRARSVGVQDLYDYLDEGRRLHYVAMTRAKENLTVVCNFDNIGTYMIESLNIKDAGMDINDNHILMYANNETVPAAVMNEARAKIEGESFTVTGIEQMMEKWGYNKK